MQLKIFLKSSDKLTLNLYLDFLENLLKKFKLKNFSKLKLPTNKKRIHFLKSPHVNKKAQEHFELRVYKAFFYLKDDEKNIIKYFLINKPKNIMLKIKRG